MSITSKSKPPHEPEIVLGSDVSYENSKSVSAAEVTFFLLIFIGLLLGVGAFLLRSNLCT